MSRETSTGATAFAWAFDTGSDPLLAGVLVAALGALGAALLLVAWIVVLRLAGVASRARAARVTAQWRPRFAAAIADAAPQAVPARRRESRAVLGLFVQLALALQGPGAVRLAAYGHGCGLEQLALRLLKRRSTRDRLLAIEALGYLGDSTSAEDLLPMCEDAHPVVSLAAARALLRLDAANAFRVVPYAIVRTDWPAARLLPMLQQAGEPAVDALDAALREVAAGRLPRALTLARALPPPRAADMVRRFLADATDPEIIIACLKLLQDPRDADFARKATGHGNWAVRVAAVQALARVASEEDLPRLTEALGDPVWWVRQRAAEAIVRLPFFAPAQLEDLRRIVSDRFAGDALARAIAERAFR